jgi:predicted small secreted protein
MERFMIKTITALLAAAFLVAGCNTMKGFGQDVQKAGEKIEDAGKKK